MSGFHHGWLLTALLCLSPGAIQAGEPPAPVEVSIQKMAFHPATLTVRVGTTVTWKNNEAGATYHAVASDEAGQFISADFFPGESWSHLFTTPGTYPYHCTPHENRMKGTIIVEP
ncbi:MAG: cupredoxin domain-containing protein [Magnetococcales bacterium]|nr:cupredoxin domain-containing protein [Magnetococcales bacterium]MBF0260596.1 cupredoxin domain-containing protein [Magnetococcales bacterium]